MQIAQKLNFAIILRLEFSAKRGTYIRRGILKFRAKQMQAANAQNLKPNLKAQRKTDKRPQNRLRESYRAGVCHLYF
ncbi:hypothetical protein CAMRE0001_1810 [Campylobacter rectus RM3267]|uniref:Uncharacterized protein n=2 Tax=Campylobacter rectus TaxID=203 RepID=A0A6G5QPE0_CAMRE|nr:hypothetical protein CAMRE0001_1810 [Campylobacter rectus RM3267]QCD47623.1 hypothetical protein CRECT_2019 [Campylobacter rectus]